MLTSRDGMEILTSEQMRRVDRRAIRSMRVPSLVLMESAGTRVVEAMEGHFRDLHSRRILVVCGKGNNGGDGLVVARHLHCLGYGARVLVVAGQDDLTGDARTNLAAARGAGVGVEIAATARAWRTFRRRLPEFDLVVDALLGTGLIGAAHGVVARVIEDLASSRIPIVAVDIPSGLSGDSSEIPGPALSAELTVSLCRPKTAHVLPPASLRCGRLVIAEIGIPAEAVASVRPTLFLVEEPDRLGFLPPRPRNAHKGDFGHALLVAGGEGKSGAAVLAARAALRSGAGLVTVATPAPVRAEISAGVPEAMTVSLPIGTPGPLEVTISPDAPRGSTLAVRTLLPTSSGARFVESWVRTLLEAAEGKSSIGLGPGLGRDAEIVASIQRFVPAVRIPLVLDADGLNAFEGRVSLLTGARRTLVLTPHPGEMARLIGCATRDVVRDRVAAVRTLAGETKAIVVLKGMASLIGAADGRVYVNTTGNPGMATGGSGDVLTGLLAALLGRGLDPLRTVLLGVWLHGRAGDLAASKLGEESLIAGDVVDHLPSAFREVSV